MGELFDAALNADDTPDGRRARWRRRWPTPTCWCRPSPTASTPALIAAAGPAFKMIANFGAGVDHIDVEAAHARGHRGHQHPGRAHRGHRRHDHGADHGRRCAGWWRARRVAQAGGYSGWSPTWMLGKRLKGAKLGIVGMGRIGQALARRARAFGLVVHYHNRKPVSAAIAEELEATYWESPRPDAGAHGRRLAQLPASRRRPTTCSRRDGSSCCSRTPSWSTPPAARSSTRRRWPTMLAARRARRRRPRRLRARADINPKLLKPPERRAPAAHELGHGRGAASRWARR